MQPDPNNGEDTCCLKKKFKGLKNSVDRWDKAICELYSFVHRFKKNMKE